MKKSEINDGNKFNKQYNNEEDMRMNNLKTF